MSQMQLRDYALLLLNVEANPKFNPEKNQHSESSMGINFNFFKKEKEDEKAFRIELDVVVNTDEKIFRNSPYRIRIKLQSFIEFDKNIEEKNIAPLLMQNGLAMTYSIARGIVGQATGTSLHNKFLLPTVNFVELIKNKIENEKKKKKLKKL